VPPPAPNGQIPTTALLEKSMEAAKAAVAMEMDKTSVKASAKTFFILISSFIFLSRFE
jgi:hypothetical protein